MEKKIPLLAPPGFRTLAFPLINQTHVCAHIYGIFLSIDTGITSSRIVEDMAIRDGLKLWIDLNLSKVVIESIRCGGDTEEIFYLSKSTC